MSDDLDLGCLVCGKREPHSKCEYCHGTGVALYFEDRPLLERQTPNGVVTGKCDECGGTGVLEK